MDELFDAWERAWSGRDPSRFEPVCADGFQYEDPLTPEPLHGAGELALHARRLWTAFPDARVNSIGPRLAGDALDRARRALASRKEAGPEVVRFYEACGFVADCMVFRHEGA